jgi:hypothetical protein
MSREYDTQLLESVSVRRNRLRSAFLLDGDRFRRSTNDNLVRTFVGAVVAAVVCAGCIGWSYVEDAVRHGKPGSAPAITRQVSR